MGGGGGSTLTHAGPSDTHVAGALHLSIDPVQCMSRFLQSISYIDSLFNNAMRKFTFWGPLGTFGELWFSIMLG